MSLELAIIKGLQRSRMKLGTVDLLFQSRVPLKVTTNGFPHHGILAHEDNSSSSQAHTNLLHLLGAHIVGTHDETFWVIIQELLK